MATNNRGRSASANRGRGGRNNNPEGRDQYSGVMGKAREAPVECPKWWKADTRLVGRMQLSKPWQLPKCVSLGFFRLVKEAREVRGSPILLHPGSELGQVFGYKAILGVDEETVCPLN